MAAPDVASVLRQLVHDADEDGSMAGGELPAPHAGARFSQRQLARLVFAGRSYQAVQAWLHGEPAPKLTSEWLLEDLQRIDARSEDRMVHVLQDEIVIVVKR